MAEEPSTLLDPGPVRFRARGPVEVSGVPGDRTPVRIPANRTAVLQAYAVFAILASLAAGGMSLPGGAAVAAGLLALPWLVRWWNTQSVSSDRSGVTVGGERWPWEEIRTVDADLVRWRIEDSSGRHREAHEFAVVITRTDGEQWALWVSGHDEAVALSDKLAFHSRAESGSEADVPESIRAHRALRQRE